ncbi:uncharacterized protein AB675_3332 [Cyphellophora attinorum]|uniref:Uncharacterized protein n=1 Tax=Cyphellophora attinorum TaxID=1664694 RepID=A0A0N1HPA5_9EURO|nr:uncharacterized protein AB675_3332 [Phialophora attinorum]KPI39527.1 hypothetical protein AB675_3332 [Phialophora attinorum]
MESTTVDAGAMASASNILPQEQDYISAMPVEILRQIFETLATSSTIAVLLGDSSHPASEAGRRGIVAVPFVNKRFRDIIKPPKRSQEDSKPLWPELITLVTVQWGVPQLSWLYEAVVGVAPRYNRLIQYCEDTVETTAGKAPQDYLRLSDTLTMTQVRHNVRHVELHQYPCTHFYAPDEHHLLFQGLPQLRTIRTKYMMRIFDVDHIGDNCKAFVLPRRTPESAVLGPLSKAGLVCVIQDFPLSRPEELASHLEATWEQNRDIVGDYLQRFKTVRIKHAETILGELSGEDNGNEPSMKGILYEHEGVGIVEFDMFIELHVLGGSGGMESELERVKNEKA